MTPKKCLSWVVAACSPGFLLLIVFETGCKPSASTSQQKVTHQRLAWNLQTTVEAYDKIGVKSVQWDEPARKCLTEFARIRSAVVSTNEPGAQIIATNAAAAVDAGCTDP